MTKTFTAFTHEVDDVDTALGEILAQLDLGGKNTLLKSTVGIVSCYAEYVESGVWKALCEKLPFQVLGTTTIANMTAGEIGETALMLMVITSDELAFATALSQPIAAEGREPLRAVYQQALAKLPGAPALMLSFAPLLNNFGSDYYVESMSEISGGVPNFGTLAVDHNPDYHDSMVLLDGDAWRDRFAILLIHGPIKPVFYVGAIADEKVFTEKGVVTASEGNQLQTVNGAPVVEYLLSLGLAKNQDGGITGINSFPIIVDYNDGTAPVARAMFAVTPEGHAVCGGNIPVGSTLSVGSFDPAEISATTARTLKTALEAGGCSTLLMYSCIGRYFSQGYDTTAEFEQLLAPLAEAGVSYLGAYSGGELCPVYGKDGGAINRNHNNSFVICAF